MFRKNSTGAKDAHLPCKHLVRLCFRCFEVCLRVQVRPQPMAIASLDYLLTLVKLTQFE